ncbi:uncharacterized protein LOC129618911 isoform X2 [Condylostylus longicornis]|uniref:uncharacterized protein LOC129618911 isoform X2 n=1 Tax=Condylostylus longicornis TaxID=2530218 RepID=UPI00244E02E5|nr:uncharacterized protein LOC129618911 isoform X2 [Condylostylus longicornis]
MFFSKLLPFNLNLSVKSFRINFRNRHFKTKSSFTARDILERSHGESGTLQTRFIKYIALENCKSENIVPKTVKYSQYYPLNTISEYEKLLLTTNQNQIPYVSIFTSTYKTNADPSNVASVITCLDDLCCENLANMDLDEIFRNLYSFMYLIPNKITKLRFYQSGLNAAVEQFSNAHTKRTFVQLSYYLGLSKGNYGISHLMKKFLKEFSEIYLDQLNSLDLAIVLNAAYKSSVLFDVKTYQDRTILEICEKEVDNDILITLLKSLRLNRVKSDDVLHKLENEIINNKRKFDFKGLCHIFENKYNKEEISQHIVEYCKGVLASVNVNNLVFNDVRPKDIATFLWCCAQLKTPSLGADDLKYFENIILKKISRNEYTKNFDELVDTCLSLWMLNYKSNNLLQEILKTCSSHSLDSKEKNTRVKLDSRFKLLINIAQIDELVNEVSKKSFHLSKDNPFDENRVAPAFLLKNNKNLSRVNDLVKKHQQELGVKNTKLVQPILELNIPSVLIEFGENQKMFLEILDDSSKLRFNNEPNAIISLKIKTLLSLKQKVFLVNIEDEDKIADKLKSAIHNETIC